MGPVVQVGGPFGQAPPGTALPGRGPLSAFHRLAAGLGTPGLAAAPAWGLGGSRFGFASLFPLRFPAAPGGALLSRRGIGGLFPVSGPFGAAPAGFFPGQEPVGGVPALLGREHRLVIPPEPSRESLLQLAAGLEGHLAQGRHHPAGGPLILPGEDILAVKGGAALQLLFRPGGQQIQRVVGNLPLRLRFPGRGLEPGDGLPLCLFDGHWFFYLFRLF